MKFRERMGRKGAEKQGHKGWTVRERKKLRKNYSLKTREELEEMFNRTWNAIKARGKIIGIQRLGKHTDDILRTRRAITSEILSLPDAERGYIAGIVDGEGCFTVAERIQHLQ